MKSKLSAAMIKAYLIREANTPPAYNRFHQ